MGISNDKAKQNILICPFFRHLCRFSDYLLTPTHLFLYCDVNQGRFSAKHFLLCRLLSGSLPPIAGAGWRPEGGGRDFLLPICLQFVSDRSCKAFCHCSSSSGLQDVGFLTPRTRLLTPFRGVSSSLGMPFFRAWVTGPWSHAPSLEKPAPAMQRPF